MRPCHPTVGRSSSRDQDPNTLPSPPPVFNTQNVTTIDFHQCSCLAEFHSISPNSTNAVLDLSLPSEFELADCLGSRAQRGPGELVPDLDKIVLHDLPTQTKAGFILSGWAINPGASSEGMPNKLPLLWFCVLTARRVALTQ